MEKIVYKSNMWVFWLAGFLFTLGYVGIDMEWYATLNRFQQIGCWILTYLIWPLLLGMELSGG